VTRAAVLSLVGSRHHAAVAARAPVSFLASVEDDLDSLFGGKFSLDVSVEVPLVARDDEKVANHTLRTCFEWVCGRHFVEGRQAKCQIEKHDVTRGCLTSQ
jgi:hypothetical protein